MNPFPSNYLSPFWYITSCSLCNYSYNQTYIFFYLIDYPVLLRNTLDYRSMATCKSCFMLSVEFSYIFLIPLLAYHLNINFPQTGTQWNLVFKQGYQGNGRNIQVSHVQLRREPYPHHPAAGQRSVTHHVLSTWAKKLRSTKQNRLAGY